MKIIFTMTFVLYCSFLYTCFNPVAGDLYPIYENISPSKPCELEGKRLFLERDGQDSSFLYDFFIGYGPQFYDTEPEDGFVIDSSSFSDRIVIKKSPTTNNIIHSTKAVNDCRCLGRLF